MLQQLSDDHDRARGQFDKLAEARRTLDAARAELTSLTKLGDLVTPEDVIKGAGKLVAGGLSPMALAKLLSDMPEKGEELQAWLIGHVQGLEQREAQLEPVLGAARHQLGVAAMRALIGHSVAGGQQPALAGPALAGPQQQPSAAPNPLQGAPSNAS